MLADVLCFVKKPGSRRAPGRGMQLPTSRTTQHGPGQMGKQLREWDWGATATGKSQLVCCLLCSTGI